MRIRYQLSKACKVIDGFTGLPLSQAVVTWGTDHRRFLNKGNGFFCGGEFGRRHFSGKGFLQRVR